MLALTVPTIFTAQDKLSPFFIKAGANLAAFGQNAAAAVARSERAFRKLTPTLSETGHKFLRLGEEALSAAAIIEGLKFTGEGIVEYDNAITSLRTKLSGLTDKEFSKFQSKVNQVASDTRESGAEVAGAFEKITSLNRKFAETAEGLAEVTKGAHLLAKIGKSDLPTAADGLVGVMNQFNLAADQSDRTINVLAASQAKHASSIADTMAGLTSLGPLAAHYNVTLEQSVGLLDVLAEKQIKGEAAGAAARMTIIKLQAAHRGYQSGVFNLSDALEEVKHKLDTFRTAKEKDNFVAALFGRRQQATGILLLENADKMKEYTKSVTGSTEAERLAGIQENTLGGFVERLKNTWINLITSQDEASSSLNILKKVIGFVTDHLTAFVLVGVSVLALFLAWKIFLIGAQIYLMLFNKGLMTTAIAATRAGAAIATETVTVGGFGTALGTVTTEFELAETAASGFFATLQAFVIPAALAAMAGWALWSAFKEYEADQHHIKPFQNKTPFKGDEKKESAYEKYLNKVTSSPFVPGVDYSDNALATRFSALYKQHPDAKSYPVPTADSKPAPVYGKPYSISSVTDTTNTSKNTFDIHLHDPGNNVKSTSMTGPLQPDVKVSQTQGQK